MKKLLPLYLLLIIGFTSCKSNEEKALELINEKMFTTLYDYESYEPIETIVTESSSTIYTDSLIRTYAVKAEAARTLYNESKHELNKALEYADIYAGSYSYSSNKKFENYVKQAKQERDNMTKYIEKWKIYEDSIKLLVADFQPQKTGWEVTHKFRCKNKGGNFTIGNYVYIMDPKFSKITDQFDMDDEAEVSLRERIDLAIKED